MRFLRVRQSRDDARNDDRRSVSLLLPQRPKNSVFLPQVTLQDRRVLVDDVTNVARDSTVDVLVDVFKVSLAATERRKRLGAHQTLGAAVFQSNKT